MLIETPSQELFDQALISDYGLALTLDSPYDARRVRRRLYAEREKLRAMGCLDYDCLSILIRNKRELWIIPRDRITQHNGVECLSLRDLGYNELPQRILSRGKSRAGVCIP